MTFNEWLLKQYGITSDDLTDDDYDMYYAQYQEKLARDERNYKRYADVIFDHYN